MDPDAVWKMLCAFLEDLAKDPDNRNLRKHVAETYVLVRYGRLSLSA